MRAMALLAGLLALTGCGYHTLQGAGVLPPHIKTIAITAFQNHSKAPNLSQRLSAAVAREFTLRTKMHVQANAAGADAVLYGDVLPFEYNPVTVITDSTTGATRATTVEVVLHVRVWIVGADGKELFRNDDMVFHDQYPISTSEQDFFEEDSSAFTRMSQSFASTLVSDVLEAF